MPAKKHHFLLLRHCVRQVPSGVDMGDEDLEDNVQDYIGIPMPNWQVGEMDCTTTGTELVQKTGNWLIKSGTISPTAKIKWEIVSDNEHRDVDTAFFLTEGIREGLERQYGNRVTSVAESDIHVDPRFSNPDFCRPIEDDEYWAKEVEHRLANMPRPTISFEQALMMVESIMGVGRAGRPLDVMLDEPELNDDNWELTGAAPFLARIGEMLFASRAGGIFYPPFAPNATPKQVFQLLQFHYWHRSVMQVGNTLQATWGGMQVQALIRVLRHGFYQNPVSAQGEEDYDTTVTIVLGHDGDLDCMATALGASWVLQEPYISGSQGAFLPTPPMSGIHAVRDVTTDRIDISFVYPNYLKSYGSSSNFELNRMGNLESAPLLFAQDLPFTQVAQGSTTIQSPKEHRKTSADILEDHTLQILAGYSDRAEECYHKAVDYWGPVDTLDPAVTLESTKAAPAAPTTVEKSSTDDVPASAFWIVLSTLLGILLLLICNRRMKKKSPAVQKSPLEKSESLSHTVSEDDELDYEDRESNSGPRPQDKGEPIAVQDAGAFKMAPCFFT